MSRKSARSSYFHVLSHLQSLMLCAVGQCTWGMMPLCCSPSARRSLPKCDSAADHDTSSLPTQHGCLRQCLAIPRDINCMALRQCASEAVCVSRVRRSKTWSGCWPRAAARSTDRQDARLHSLLTFLSRRESRNVTTSPADRTCTECAVVTALHATMQAPRCYLCLSACQRETTATSSTCSTAFCAPEHPEPSRASAAAGDGHRGAGGAAGGGAGGQPARGARGPSPGGRAMS